MRTVIIAAVIAILAGILYQKVVKENMEVKDLIGETTEYDKKQFLEVRKPKSWCKSVSAFANTFGGALIFGIWETKA